MKTHPPFSIFHFPFSIALALAAISGCRTATPEIRVPAFTVTVEKPAPAPDQVAAEIRQMLQENLPLVVRELGLVPEATPKAFQVLFKDGLREWGAFGNDTLYLNPTHFCKTSDNGLVIHALATYLPHYPTGKHAWLITGIGAWLRDKIKTPEAWSLPSTLPAEAKWTDGQEHAALLLRYIESTYRHGIVPKLVRAMQRDEDPVPIFQAHTGRSLDQLWEECRKSLLKPHRLTVTCDVRSAPEMAEFGNTCCKLAKTHYPAICKILGNQGEAAPQTIRFVLIRRFPYPAACTGEGVALGIEWFQKNPGDLGAVIHEMTHVAQNYPQHKYSWLSEGLTDYVRYRIGLDDGWKIPDGYHPGQKLENGYRDTAAFLLWVEKKDAGLIPALHQAFCQGTMTLDIFRQRTGLDLNELWEAYQRETGPGSKK
jgi:hypothetical protein